MIKLFISFVIALGLVIGIAAGASAVWWWDRRDPGVPSITFHVLFFHPKWVAPLSLKAQADAIRSQYTLCQKNNLLLNSAIDTQNKAVQALGVASAKEKARANKAIAQWQSRQSQEANTIRELEMPIAGTDVCTRVKAIDERFVSTLP